MWVLHECPHLRVDGSEEPHCFEKSPDGDVFTHHGKCAILGGDTPSFCPIEGCNQITKTDEIRGFDVVHLILDKEEL